MVTFHMLIFPQLDVTLERECIKTYTRSKENNQPCIARAYDNQGNG